MFAGVSNIEIGDKKVANIYLGQDPTPVYTISESPFESTPYFEDSFQGTSLDTAKWNQDLGIGQNGWGNNELQYFTDDGNNITVNNGLTITAKNESYRGRDYTSARLRTINNWFRYGKLVVRAKTNSGRGLWPAIYMFTDHYHYFDLSTWPEAGELDIIEVNGNNPNIAHTSVHTAYYNYNTGRPKHKQTTISGLGDDFRDYEIQWTPEYIRWFVDGEQVYEFLNDNINTDRWPFDRPTFLQIGLNVGGQFPGTVNPADYPASLDIESVKYYRLKGYEVIPVPVEVPFPIVTPNHQNTGSGDISVSCESAREGDTVEWYSYGSLIHTGENLILTNIGPLGVYNFEVVIKDSDGNYGHTNWFTALVVPPAYPSPTFDQSSYESEWAGELNFGLTNRPTGASTEIWVGAPLAGQNLGIHEGDTITFGPPITSTQSFSNVPFYFRYRLNGDVSDWSNVPVTVHPEA